MREIPLTNGGAAIVDDEDYEELSKWNWRRDKKGYASRTTTKNRIAYAFLMHRVVAKTPSGMQTDHINGNKLDNRRSNLRVCTNQQNMRNRPPYFGTSKYKGVRWREKRRKWVAQITVNEKTIHLGHFDDEIEAAKAYDQAALKYHGDFAWLNRVG